MKRSQGEVDKSELLTWHRAADDDEEPNDRRDDFLTIRHAYAKPGSEHFYSIHLPPAPGSA